MKNATRRPVWSGSVTFGLVAIPVKLYPAVQEKRLHFRSLHDQDQVPVKQRLVCPADGQEVHREHLLKGYEIEKDRFVIVRQEELDAAAPKASRAIEIEDFVALDDIDLFYFDKHYYVAPQPEGEKPYRLLTRAMERKKKVGIARFVMRNKEYLAALRAFEGVLCLDTMHFEDEVVEAKEIAQKQDGKKVSERELKVAEQIIDSLTTDFKPGQYHDEYREAVMKLIEKKARGEKVVTRREPEPKPARGGDLIKALEASLAQTRERGKPRAKKKKST